MNIISNHNEFMAGIYIIEFETKNKADSFIDKYSCCPIWVVVTRGTKENEVVVISIELRRQRHGDFSQEENTLVKNPDFLGAKAVKFKRDDTLIEFFGNYSLKTGYSDIIPCGSKCETCISFKNPCRGCPAYYKY